MTLEEVIELQTKENLRDSHLVYLDEDGFHIAHTDEERTFVLGSSAWHRLVDCPLHQWLEWQCDQPAPTGLYTAQEGDDGAWMLESWSPGSTE